MKPWESEDGKLKLGTQVRLEDCGLSLKRINYFLAAIGVQLELHAVVEHAVYYIDGARLGKLDGTPYTFIAEEDIDQGETA